MKTRKPTDEEIEGWGDYPPLVGFVLHDGHELPVEKIDDPDLFEVHAPDGMQFAGGPLSMICSGKEELERRVAKCTLEPDPDAD